MTLCKTSLFLPASTNLKLPIPFQLQKLPISKISVDSVGHSFPGGEFKYLKVKSPKFHWTDDRSIKAFSFESRARFLASFPFDKKEEDLGEDKHFTFPINSILQEDIKVIEKELSKVIPDKQLVSCLKEDLNQQCYFTSKVKSDTPVFQEGSTESTAFKDIPTCKMILSVFIRLTGVFMPKEGNQFHLTSTIEQIRWKKEVEKRTFMERIQEKTTKLTYKECQHHLRAFNDAWLSTQSEMRGPFLFLKDDFEPYDQDDVSYVISPSFKARIDDFLVPLFANPNFKEFIATQNEFLEKEEKEWYATYQTQPEDFMEMNREELYLMYLRDMLSFLPPLHLLFRLISDENKDEVSKEVKAVLQIKPTSTLLKYVYRLLEKHLKPHQPLIFGEEREDITLQPFVSMFWDLYQCECLYQLALEEWARPPVMPTPQHYYERWRRAFHVWSNDFSNKPHPEIGQFDFRMKKVVFRHMCEASNVLNAMANQFIDASRYLGDIQNTLETFFARYQDAKWSYDNSILEYGEEERYSAQTY